MLAGSKRLKRNLDSPLSMARSTRSTRPDAASNSVMGSPECSASSVAERELLLPKLAAFYWLVVLGWQPG
ncbi:MAG TPA: hypothetical protein VJN18_31640 [Polyangiaceae bacterium]|nr:hypothetical protein [Polyangiaceae bacterium]